MSTVLVVYGTKTGCTKGVAEKIAETLEAAGAEVTTAAAAEAPAAGDFDVVVVGSGVRAGSWHAAVKKWVAEHATALKDRPVSFFTVGLTIAQFPEKAEEVRAYTDALIAETGVEPFSIGLFAGCNDPKTFSLPERLVLKALKAPQGDLRDFDAIQAWARDIASSVSR